MPTIKNEMKVPMESFLCAASNHLLVIFTLLIIPSAGFSQLVIEPSDVVDLGEIEEGKVAKVDFRIVNRSKNTYTVGFVKTSCGCTTAEPSKKEIGPGEETVISANYDSKNRPGPFRREINVFMNGADNPSLAMFISGNVVNPKGPRLVTDEQRISLGVQAISVPVSRQVTIRNKGTDPLVISSAEFDKKPVISGEITIQPASSYNLELQIPDGMAEGLYSGMLTIQSNDPQRKRTVLPVTGWFEKRMGVVIIPEREVDNQVIVKITNYTREAVLLTDLMAAGSFKLLAGKDVLKTGEMALVQVKKGTEIRHRL